MLNSKQISIISSGILFVGLLVLSFYTGNASRDSTQYASSVMPSVSSRIENNSSLHSVACSSEVSSSKPEPTYTSDELYCMAAAIYNEAGGDSCSDDTRRMVGYVILNRVNDSRYPDTIRGVLEQRHQYGVFYITGVKFADRCKLPQEQHAVKRAYAIAKEVLETENIPIPSTVVFQAEFKQGISIYKYQDEMYFCHAKEVK